MDARVVRNAAVGRPPNPRPWYVNALRGLFAVAAGVAYGFGVGLDSIARAVAFVALVVAVLLILYLADRVLYPNDYAR